MRNKELYDNLTKQAFEEELPRVGPGVFGALPNDFGRALRRLTELCEENGICHMCAYPIDECVCNVENESYRAIWEAEEIGRENRDLSEDLEGLPEVKVRLAELD